MTEETIKPPLGHEVIQSYLKTIDTSPGVYRMLDAESRVLYVGKARNLRARVGSYARPTGHSPRIARMIANTASMMFLTTRTETEALLLEQNLIKQLKPKFNVLLRDDKSFPNILVTTDQDFPQIKKHRGAKKEKGAYYGPFASAGAVNRTLNQLQRVFLLRDCSDAMFDSRTRPCLQHQIKRCSAPCVGKISSDEYRQSVRDAERFLSGRTTDIQARLAGEMAQASQAVVVVNPGWGDSVQANKAGLMEIADIFVINKADRKGVDETQRDLMQMLDLGAMPHDAWRPPIIPAVGTTGQGVTDIWDAVLEHRAASEASGELERRRTFRLREELREIIANRLGRRAREICTGDRWDELTDEVVARTTDPWTAADEMLSAVDA